MIGIPVRQLVAAGLFLAVAATVPFGPFAAPTDAIAVQATPAAGNPCAAATPTVGMAMGTPMAGMAMGTPMAGMDHSGMDMGSPMAGMEGMAMELDQLYIDMMIPHHASIVAMAQAALTRLEDERLVEIAERIVATQSAEIEELRGYRTDFYGGAEPMPMDDHSMGMMAEAMPGMTGDMDEMAAQMDPRAQVAAICAAGDADLAFIDLTIPHHESAIAASEAAVERATHDEIRAFAERVIADQRREIDELRAIRAELAGTASPEAGG